ncbi:hypothetical protein VTK73DRAFT_601 [Phialemonium thermophilum]|uniref:Uncharacterized protein n=1 Tax=Phialemonium thermophilum TaxID=223376 RepID=A0ABR3VUN2_9PEZI
MMAGKGAWPDEGLRMVTEKEMDRPWSDTVMDRVLPEKEAVRLEGLPGREPSSYFCSRALSSAWRQAQSALVATFLPPAKVKGSGSVEVDPLMLPGTAGQLEGLPGLPGPVDVVVVVVVVVTAVGDEEGGGGGSVVVAAPGRHWAYQGFWVTQCAEGTQEVGPVQPWPPHWPQTVCWPRARVARATKSSSEVSWCIVAKASSCPRACRSNSLGRVEDEACSLFYSLARSHMQPWRVANEPTSPWPDDILAKKASSSVCSISQEILQCTFEHSTMPRPVMQQQPSLVVVSTR